MNTTTTEAATQAHVTVATIRTWCRTGVVAAVKQAGRWLIDSASLAHRLVIAAMKTGSRKPAALTADKLIALGGRRWTKNGMDRIYLNDWHTFAGIEYTQYNTGNISSAAIGGRGIANGRLAGILGQIKNVYFDLADGRLHARHYGADCVEVRFLDGHRDYLDLLAMTFDGIRRAAAAA